MRLFVGVWPSGEVRNALAELPRPELAGLRWTTAEQWHVTIRFLGEVGDDALPELRAAVAGVADALSPRQATLGPATTRLGRGALVVPVAGLDDLGMAAIGATARFGAPPVDRPFTAHVTVARGRGGRAVPTSVAGEAITVSWHVGEIALIRSTLHPGGARYEDLEVLALTGSRAR